MRSLVSGSILLPGILSDLVTAADGAVDGAGARGPSTDPLAPRVPQFPAKAKQVIFLFMTGGVSHLETFDPKPRLARDQGKQHRGRKLVGPQWPFRRRGRVGAEVSDLFPHIGGCMDDICLIRSMKGDHGDHFQATLGVHSGSVSVKRPSLGSWVSYGLGTFNQNLPSFVVLAPKLPYAGTQVWSSDFLPASHQGTRVLGSEDPIPNLKRLSPSRQVQEMELSLLERYNRRHLGARAADPTLAARMRSFETAFGMQQAMPDVLDLSKESDETLGLYGLERGSTEGFAWQCIVARRLAERGVRFIELIDQGSRNNWDSHSDMSQHGPMARNVDQPIAGLLKDLKRRGMLEDTLVVWTTEFGRSPRADGPKGRSHHAKAYSSWLAGAGVKAGLVHGVTDHYGEEVVEDKVHVHDFHATILHLLGFDHERLTFRHAGRDFRLTDVHGRVVDEILA